MTETELARKLGISRKCLWERRQRLGIPRRKSGPRPTRNTLLPRTCRVTETGFIGNGTRFLCPPPTHKTSTP